MSNKRTHMYACDFETTVYKGQKSTEVWSAAITEIYGKDETVLNFRDIDSFFDHIFTDHKMKKQIYYFHNLKFDGEFIIYWLMNNGYKADYTETKKPMNLKDDSYNTVISNLNQWYIINIKVNGRLYIFRDSLKLLPFTLSQIGKSFKTKHQKTTMIYEGERRPGYVPDDKETEYINNDVLVLREALEKMFDEGFNGLTIGQCCMSIFKKQFFGMKRFKEAFPNLEEIIIDESFGDINADSYIRRAYRGGWCYTRFTGYEAGPGKVFDVNSLYPSVMHSLSGSYYPVGQPHFWQGNYIPRDLLRKDGYNPEFYFYIKFECSFKLKPNKLPFVSIKDSIYYKSTEMLSSSQIYDKYHTPLRVFDRVTGEFKENTVVLTMSCIDFKLFLQHYKVDNFKILSGVYFMAIQGLFDDYIDHFMNMKIQASINKDPVKRQIAKLCLNNLYGKFAASSDSSYKECFIDPESLCTEFIDIEQHEKTPGYIAVGAAVTSWARYFTITAAQKNYKSFRYADTDSLHLELGHEDEVFGIEEDDNKLCCWKMETEFNNALYVRAKTYIEYDKKNDEYIIKCAGLPNHCKMLFESTVRFEKYEDRIKWLEDHNELLQGITEKENEFLKHYHELFEFGPGFIIPGKLMPVHIPGGVLLRKVDFTLR